MCRLRIPRLSKCSLSYSRLYDRAGCLILGSYRACMLSGSRVSKCGLSNSRISECKLSRISLDLSLRGADCQILGYRSGFHILDQRSEGVRISAIGVQAFKFQGSRNWGLSDSRLSVSKAVRFLGYRSRRLSASGLPEPKAISFWATGAEGCQLLGYRS